MSHESGSPETTVRGTHPEGPRPEASVHASNVCYTAVLVMTAHAVAIGSALAFTALSESHPTPDANIGTGFGMLALAGLGLPWTGPYLTGRFGELSDLGEVALFASLAMLNLVLHGSYWAVRIRRRGSSASG